MEAGSKNDRGLFQNSDIYTKLENNTLVLASSQEVTLDNDNYGSESRDLKIPIIFVADGCFFSQYCMRPYSKRNCIEDKIFFNYRFCRKWDITEIKWYGLIDSGCLENSAILAPDKALTVVRRTTIA